MDLLLELKDLQFASPVFLLAGIFLAGLLVTVKLLQMKKRQKGDIGLAELKDIYKKQIRKARTASYMRMFFLALAIVGIGATTAGPYSQNVGEISRTRTIENVRTIMVALDVSGSMKLKSPSGEQTVFEMSRDQAVDFLESQENIRAGFIFYSDWSLIWRRPTLETKDLARELAYMNINRPMRGPYGEFGGSQLSIFSGGTHTPRALYAAGQVFYDIYVEEGLRDGAVILLTDLQDRLGEVEEAINSLTKNGIRVYVLANSRNEKTIDMFRQRMAKNPRVWVFNASLGADMSEAYERISELESSPLIIKEVVPAEKNDLRLQTGLAVFGFLFIFAIAGEMLLRRARGGG
ncbi:MAG: vWA domain-containing protein [Candidatus Spechtbacterales bacterium]